VAYGWGENHVEDSRLEYQSTINARRHGNTFSILTALV
jgi:hypothetical protein